MTCCREGRDRDSAVGDGPGRLRAVIEWAVPLAVLWLTPKCPACVAGYAMLFAGVGVSLTAAAYIRWAMLASGGIVLLYLIARGARSRMRRAVVG